MLEISSADDEDNHKANINAPTIAKTTYDKPNMRNTIIDKATVVKAVINDTRTDTCNIDETILQL